MKDNVMLIHLSVARCGVAYLTHVPLLNLNSLDLRDNQLTTINWHVLARLSVLKVLLLAGNPLTSAFLTGPLPPCATTVRPGGGGAAISTSRDTTTSEQTSGPTPAVCAALAGSPSSSTDLTAATPPAPVPAGPRALPALTVVDISRTCLSDFDVSLLRVFPGVRFLNLSHSGLRRVQGAGFSSLTWLTVLDLRGCPLVGFSRDVFQGTDRLAAVYADDYKLCCGQVLPASTLVCQAPGDLFSSCTRLIGRNSHRVALCTYAAVTLVMNLLSLWARGCLPRPCRKSADTPPAPPPPPRRPEVAGSRDKSTVTALVQHLAVSDLLRGVQLSVTSVADYLHGDGYLGRDGAWRGSAACQASGFLALLSGQVSTLLVFLLTLNTALALRRPSWALRPAPLRVACGLVWGGAGLVALTPLLPGPAAWGVYSHSAICLPLPFSTRGAGPGWDFCVGVTVVFSGLLLSLTCAAQVFIGVTLPERVSLPSLRPSVERRAEPRALLAANSPRNGRSPAGVAVTGSSHPHVARSGRNDVVTTPDDDSASPAAGDIISPSLADSADRTCNDATGRTAAGKANRFPKDVTDPSSDEVVTGPSNDVTMETGSDVTNASRGDVISLPRNDAAGACRELRSAGRARLLSALQGLCWLPLGVVSVTSHYERHLADQAYVALAVFVLPLSSALAPLLYALAIRRERRRWEEEEQFIKHVLAKKRAHRKAR